jgi:hypothetical protein
MGTRVGTREANIDWPGLRATLAAARRAGVPFQQAWPLATAGLDGDDREVLQATAAAWAAGYERREVYGAAPVIVLASALAAEPGERSRVVERW